VSIRIRFGRDFLFRLNPAVAANVLDLNSMVDQHPADQQLPVARDWIFLGAKYRYVVFADSPLQSRQTLLEKRSCRDAVVQDMAFVIVKFISLGPSAQFPPEIEVTNSNVLEDRLQRFVIELRGVLGVRLGTRVHDDLDRMRFQQS